MNAHRSNRGFTLLEVMVALAIIATALVTLLGTHLTNLSLAYENQEQTMAAMLARQKMEEILVLPFDSVTDDSGDFGPDQPGYKWELEVENADIDNLKKVRILIKLPDGDFALETSVARTMVE